MYDKAAEEAGKVDAEVQKLHNKIMGITGGRMKTAQKKVDEVTNNLDKVRKEITKLRVAIKTAERSVISLLLYVYMCFVLRFLVIQTIFIGRVW